jgi:predicted nucleic acid-binding Zn ribbon protein
MCPIYEIECKNCGIKEELMTTYNGLLEVLNEECCTKCKGPLIKCVSKPAQAQWAGDKSFSVTGGKGTKE